MIDKTKIDWQKGDGLVPAIVQDAATGAVLMLGYMNAEALDQTLATGRVTFFSRSKNRLWEKGETSGHTLTLTSIDLDCDGDALLVKAQPLGPTCHRGTATCFGVGDAAPSLAFLAALEGIIDARAKADPSSSYVARLLAAGLSRMAQKVGEEGVEVALAATTGTKEKLAEESADLVFHLMVVWRASGLSLCDIAALLEKRHAATQNVLQ